MSDDPPRDAGNGFGLLDGAAVVTGAAVASVHIRAAIPDQPTAIEWGMASLLFALLTITSAGPFVYLVRKNLRRLVAYPRLGDRLWLVEGLPWLVAALVRTAGASYREPSRDLPYSTVLVVGLGLAIAVALATILYCWQATAPGERSLSGGTVRWTDRIGLALTIAWPLQCGAGLVVMG